MTELTIIDGGNRTLDLDKATVLHIHRATIFNGVRTWIVELFIDDMAKQERLVLKVHHRTTLAGRKPCHGSDEVTLYTLYGYDQAQGKWGPTERRADMEISWQNGRRLVNAIHELAQQHFYQLCPPEGAHWYRRK